MATPSGSVCVQRLETQCLSPSKKKPAQEQLAKPSATRHLPQKHEKCQFLLYNLQSALAELLYLVKHHGVC